LPKSYQKRMYSVLKTQPRLFELSDEVITCSRHLSGELTKQHDSVHVLLPSLISPLPTLSHYNSDSKKWSIAYHGQRVHLEDFKSVVPSLLKINANFPEVCYKTMLGRRTPTEISHLKTAHDYFPRSWNAFCRYQKNTRIHIGLAPLQDTAFNRGKSFIKFLDIAAMGGVGVYSNCAPYTDIVEQGKNGLLAEYRIC